MIGKWLIDFKMTIMFIGKDIGGRQMAKPKETKNIKQIEDWFFFDN